MGFFDFFKNRKTDKNISTSGEFTVKLPEERFASAEFRLSGKPYIGVFNTGIMELEPKEVFGWYLSLIIGFEKTVGSDMPDRETTSMMQDFCDSISDGVAADRSHPNALFLGRVTGGGQTQMMWYVNNPRVADDYLRRLIDSKEYPFQFSYEMSFDGEWKEAHYWLDPLSE